METDIRIRKPRGRRKKITEKYEGIEAEIERMLTDETCGDLEQVLTWTHKSLRYLEGVLQQKGYTISHKTIAKVMKEMGYSLQHNQKMVQHGEPYPDIDAQFTYISTKSCEFIEKGLPVISVDTKKQVFIGDFPIQELEKIAPYGVYNVSEDESFVHLGISHDTFEFAVESILRWWQTLGKNTYPKAKELYITCDNGGSNGSNHKLWKKQLQEMATITGLSIHVSYVPSGTSKWKKIEHTMFFFISENWKGLQVLSIETAIRLISSTTSKRLNIVCAKDKKKYELGTVVTYKELAAMNIVKSDFNGDWNYVIHPKK